MTDDPRDPEEADDAAPGLRLDLSKFLGTPSRSLLRLLLDGDPLSLERRSTARRDELAYLISSDRIFLRTVARVSYHACTYGVDGPDDDWIGAVVDESIRDLLSEDRESARANEAVEREDDYAYQAVMELLDVSAESARAVCVAFNTLSFDVRRTYMTYCRDRSLTGMARGSDADPAGLREDLAKALLRIVGGKR